MSDGCLAGVSGSPILSLSKFPNDENLSVALFAWPQRIFQRFCLANMKMRASYIFPFLPLLITGQVCITFTLGSCCWHPLRKLAPQPWWYITYIELLIWNLCSAVSFEQSTGPCSACPHNTSCRIWSSSDVSRVILLLRYGTLQPKIGKPTIIR